jgi:glycerol-3-phosphate dehydrogenase
VRAYGTLSWDVLGQAETKADLGIEFGATLTEREVVWLVSREFARTAEDIVWRRNKLGLRLSSDEIASLESWLQAFHHAVKTSASEQTGERA